MFHSWLGPGAIIELPGIFQQSTIAQRGKVIFQTNPLADWVGPAACTICLVSLQDLQEMSGVLVGWDNDACFLGVSSRGHVEILETAMYQQVKHLRSNVNDIS